MCSYIFYVTFFLKFTATAEIYTYAPTRSLLEALPISTAPPRLERTQVICQPRRAATSAIAPRRGRRLPSVTLRSRRAVARSEEHTSELQSLMRISYAVFCLKKKKHKKQQ